MTSFQDLVTDHREMTNGFLEKSMLHHPAMECIKMSTAFSTRIPIRSTRLTLRSGVTLFSSDDWTVVSEVTCRHQDSARPKAKRPGLATSSNLNYYYSRALR